MWVINEVPIIFLKLGGFMTKRIRVTLIGIKVLDEGDDPGGNLEIYGDLSAQRFSTNWPDRVVQTETFWHADSDNYLTIAVANLFEIYVRKEMIIEPGEILFLGGHLWDQDTNPDDSLGYQRVEIPYHAIGNSTYEVPFNAGSNGVAEARYSTTLL
jgi:hypothetical protein